jgi:hypothetical protein
MATKINHAIDAEATDRKYWRFLPKKLQIRSFSSNTVRSIGIFNKNDERWICKHIHYN